jgi:hypothetical protein
MPSRRLFKYCVISLISIKTFAWATPAHEQDESSPWIQNPAIAELSKKAASFIQQDSYLKAQNQFESVALNGEKVEQRTEIKLPDEPQFSALITQYATSDFAEHATWLKQEAGEVRSLSGLKVAVRFGSKDYIDYVCKEYCAARSHLGLITQAIGPVLFSALLEASTPVDPLPILPIPATSLSAIGCGAITLPEKENHFALDLHTFNLPQSTAEAVGVLTFLGSLGD